MQRGEIWWASLPEPTGSGPGYRWPVLIVQANDFNRSRVATVVIVPLTSNLRLADAPGNVRLESQATGLSRDSVANVSQVMAVDKSLLTQRVAALPRDMLQQVEAGLRLVLAL